MPQNAISGRQCRAARGALGLTQEEVAEAAGISRGTVAALEGGGAVLEVSAWAVAEAFRRLGVGLDRDGAREAVSFPAEDAPATDPAAS